MLSCPSSCYHQKERGREIVRKGEMERETERERKIERGREKRENIEVL